MYSMVPTTMLDELVDKFKPKIIVEIGAYYGGWSVHLDKISADDARIFSFQSPLDKKLNHVPNTDRGEHHNAFGWKEVVKESFPTKYHNYFDFNLLLAAISTTKKVTLICDTSPLNYDWKYQFDLCTIDISPDFEENKKQFLYWSKFANAGGVVAIGAYGHQQEMSSYITQNCADFEIVLYGPYYVWAIKK
jgi:hypothetical protein